MPVILSAFRRSSVKTEDAIFSVSIVLPTATKSVLLSYTSNCVIAPSMIMSDPASNGWYGSVCIGVPLNPLSNVPIVVTPLCVTHICILPVKYAIKSDGADDIRRITDCCAGYAGAGVGGSTRCIPVIFSISNMCVINLTLANSIVSLRCSNRQCNRLMLR